MTAIVKKSLHGRSECQIRYYVGVISMDVFQWKTTDMSECKSDWDPKIYPSENSHDCWQIACVTRL